MSAEPVDFFLDPGCPFTWRTSRWAVELEETNHAAVTWRLMSLGYLNGDKDVPEQYREPMRQGSRVLRVLRAAEEEGGSAAVGSLYSALGRRHHDDGQPYSAEVVAEAVREAGLPESVAAAADDESRDAAVRASHEESQAAVGQESGSPVLRIQGRGFFGPVVVPTPTGEDAVRLLEAVRMLARVPAFSELKTNRGSF